MRFVRVLTVGVAAAALAVGVAAPAVAAPVAKPRAPQAVKVTAGDGQVALSWSKPKSGGPVVRYQVYRAEAASGPFTKVASPRGLSFTVKRLSNGTKYWFRVASSNKAGESGFVTVSATPKSAPSVPTAVSTVPGDRQVVLSWAAPVSDGGSAVTGYRVSRSTSKEGPWTAAATVAADRLTHTFTNLSNGTAYWFRVAAVSAAGDGAAERVSATPRTVPGAPAGIKATAGAGQAVVEWVAPRADGGDKVKSYAVYSATSNSGPWTLAGTSTATSFTVTGLTNGLTYWFRVAAVNSAGEGAASSTASASPRTVPDAPQNLTATTPANFQIALSWFPPASSGGAAISTYTVYAAPAASGPWTVLGKTASTKLNDSSLPAGSTFFYRVTAMNAAGESAASNVVSATALGAFTAPTVKSAVPKSATSEQMTITFAPGNPGGRVIAGYQYSTDNGSTWQPVVAWDNTTLTTQDSVAPAVNGFSYRIRAVASNGDVSAISPAVTKPTAPTATVKPLRGSEAAGGASLDLMWATLTTANYYKVYRTPVYASNVLNVVEPSFRIDKGLAWGTRYTYQFAACNAGGCTYGSQIAATTAPAPAGFKLEKATNTSIKVTVATMPVGAQSYRIKYCDRTAKPSCDPDEAATGTVVRNAAGTYTLSGLKAGSTYAFVVVSTSGTSGAGTQTVSDVKTLKL